MEIKNTKLFLAGIIGIVLGSFIVVFDHPQIQYLESVESESYLVLDAQNKEIYQRLQIESAVGAMILVAGMALLFVSVLKSKER